MAEITCYADTCKYWQESNYCSCTEIKISEDKKCNSYVTHRGSVEGQSRFKKTTYGSITSKCEYIDHNIYNKETRQYCGKCLYVKYPEGVEKFAEQAKNLPPVMSSPIARIDRRTGELTPVEESEEEK